MARYTALIDGSADAYGVVVPDLPGCTAMGSTVEEALRNAADAVRDWVEVAKEAGEAVPPPRPVEVLRKDINVAEELTGGAMTANVPLIQTGLRRL